MPGYLQARSGLVFFPGIVRAKSAKKFPSIGNEREYFHMLDRGFKFRQFPTCSAQMKQRKG